MLNFFDDTDEEIHNEWLFHLDEAKANSSELYEMLNNRSVMLAKKKDASLLSAQIRRNIAKLKGQLNGLQGLLKKHNEKISESEFTRRSDELTRIRREVNLMEDNMQKEGRVNNAMPKTDYRNVTEREGKETERTTDVPTNQLANVQAQMLKEQDAELDQLSKHIRNLQGISGAINEEITMHNHMLEDLESDMEKSSNKMHQGKVKLDNMESESSCIIS
mmetsp:Transcript_28005/g.61297  ORF Transcript_28005/g.61297 Transcript_28005/m.61297 type:complete len:219 (-) Transcript_28005:209-865(-)|eukprot:CAMPEP_0118935066 /NCGR_PEP_ID=MMETSP1169-20130426/14850_1 /TAXON_ID=36882 /ORGANISM="Pyramimonas obovata, Strain CCMP722" /LENGTH=218 /DNA_ID=CAMNT_0006878049 /DNA_START=229 /DNA_END=885 /DNA_ORIENTATION=-